VGTGFDGNILRKTIHKESELLFYNFKEIKMQWGRWRVNLHLPPLENHPRAECFRLLITAQMYKRLLKYNVKN
jgi:hypothetical protein